MLCKLPLNRKYVQTYRFNCFSYFCLFSDGSHHWWDAAEWDGCAGPYAENLPHHGSVCIYRWVPDIPTLSYSYNTVMDSLWVSNSKLAAHQDPETPRLSVTSQRMLSLFHALKSILMHVTKPPDLPSIFVGIWIISAILNTFNDSCLQRGGLSVTRCGERDIKRYQNNQQSCQPPHENGLC